MTAIVSVAHIEAAAHESSAVYSVDVIEGFGEVTVLVWPKWWARLFVRRVIYRVRERFQGRTAAGIRVFVGHGRIWP